MIANRVSTSPPAGIAVFLMLAYFIFICEGQKLLLTFKTTYSSVNRVGIEQNIVKKNI